MLAQRNVWQVGFLGLGLFLTGVMFPLPLWGGTTLSTPVAVGTSSGGDAMFLILGGDHRIWYTIFDENSSIAASTAGYAGFSTTLNENNPFATVTEGTVNDGFVDPGTFPGSAVAGFIWQPVPGTKTFQDEPHVVRTSEGDLVIFALGLDGKIWYTYFDLNAGSDANAVISQSPFSSNSDNPFAKATEGSTDDGWADSNTFPVGTGAEDIWVPVPEGGTFASSPDVVLAPSGDLLLAARGTDDQPLYTYFDLNNSGTFGSTGNSNNPFSTSGLEGSVNDGWPDSTVGTFANESGRVGIWLPLPTGKTAATPALVNTTNGGDVMILLRGSDNRVWYTFYDENSSIGANSTGFAGFGSGNNSSNPFTSATEGSSNDGFPDPGTIPSASATGLAWIPFPGGGALSDEPRVARTNEGDLIVSALGQDGRNWYTYFDLNGSSAANAVISQAAFSNNTANPFAIATEGGTDDGFPDSNTFLILHQSVGVWVPVPGAGRFASSAALLLGASGDLLFVPRGLDDRIWYTYFDLNDTAAASGTGFGGGNANNSFTTATEGSDDDGWVDPGTHVSDDKPVGIWLAMPN